ncbi:D-alanine transaminase [Rhodobium orientis]|uniref:Probable branched-chain-amino-acid aminotransferase n=1 Tax=Rhodobium orientis TaxID=34017 RepID=A0A327JLD9_9HYPH|nr:D-amino-acid transaminase [Rhodobium orientis]MBB4301959.1 D-alanine transaminase [Rhodobium orientis]MBK5950196.1 D-amino acid aminotransferase [Rhodobium orientis]RAI27260.1 D-amino acid aminotransferase [Rhodobium orientis]
MARTVYVNGAFLAEDDAKISVFDRGFLFADGVYEVTTVLKGKLVDFEPHMARLNRSLSALQMARPMGEAELRDIHEKLVALNELDEGIVYLQVTRGIADRDFAYPTDAAPSLVMFTQARPVVDNPKVEKGIAVMTVPDIRWRRRDIKTVGLLPASMAKQAALEAGYGDAWFVEDGFVTEGSSNNAFIVNAEGAVITRQLTSDILHGITRDAILRLAREDDITIIERPFTPGEAENAKEAFITSASTFLMPVVAINHSTIGDGTPGPISRKLRQHYVDAAFASIGEAVD